MRQYCTLCRRPIERATSAFKPPRLAQRRALWEQACGRTLMDNRLICQRHFSPEQYRQMSTKKCLHPNAVPWRNMHSGDYSDTDEPPRAFELINEEDFDGVTASVSDSSCGDEKEEMDVKGDEKEEEMDIKVDLPLNLNNISPKYSQHTKSVQTGSATTQTCGLIEVTSDYNIYTMNCFYCDEIFPIWSWTKFVKHIQEQHRQQEQRTTGCDDNDNETGRTQHGIFKVQPQSKEAEVKIELEVDQEESEAIKLDGTQSNAQVEMKNSQKKTTKKTYKKVDKLKVKVKEATEDSGLPAGIFCKELPIIVENNDCSTSDDDVDDEEDDDLTNQRPRDPNQIYLRDPPAIVNDFLALWKTYPILWHNRPGHNDAAYNHLVVELTAKLNAKWALSKTHRGMHQSLYRFRKWFYGVRNFAPSGEKTQVGKYYDICTEFLPNRKALPVSCSKCIFYFADEQQLQAHYAQRHETFCQICHKHYPTPTKYRRHKIVHEPPAFTCPTCGKQYHRVAGLQDHMRAHRNERNFVCDKCGKGFVRSKTLREHTLQVHFDNPAYKCRICGERFNTWNAVIFHKRREHMVLEGTIEDLEKQRIESRSKKCNNKYIYVFDAATGTNRTACDVCGKTYRLPGAMVRHKVRAHGYIKPIFRRYKKKKRVECDDDGDDDGNNSDSKAANQEVDADDNVQRAAVESMEDDDNYDDDEEEEEEEQEEESLLFD